MKKIPTLIVSLAALFLIPGCGEIPGAFNITNWQVRVKTSPKTEKKSAPWKKIKLPYIIKPVAADNDTICRRRLRAEFILPRDPHHFYGLFIEGISSFEKVTLNGIEIGGREKFEYNTMFISRHYRVPAGILKEGKNILTLDIGMLNRENGGLAGEVQLLPEKAYIKKRIFTDLLFLQVPFGIIFLDAGFIILLSLFYLLNRNQKQSLFCASALLLYVIYLATLFSPYKFLPVTISFAIQLVISIVRPFLLIIIYQAFYGFYLSTFNKISSIVTFCLALLLFIAAAFSFHPTLLRVIHVTALIYLGGIFIYTISQLNSFQRDPFLFRFIIFISATALIMVSTEIVTSLSGGIYSELVTVYISPLYIIAFSLLYSRYMTSKEVEIRLLYRRLEGEKSGDETTSPLSDAAEKKMQQVITFLKENYTSDISREGLAHAIDMNPNYMSRIFKQYTGAKLNDYINTLRIDDARERLTGSNSKIIDIALETGFESLATFNRVFKQITGKTPSQYRTSL